MAIIQLSFVAFDSSLPSLVYAVRKTCIILRQSALGKACEFLDGGDLPNRFPLSLTKGIFDDLAQSINGKDRESQRRR